jgi:hypothetical protein
MFLVATAVVVILVLVQVTRQPETQPVAVLKSGDRSIVAVDRSLATNQEKSPAQLDRPPGFREVAQESGITFRMVFLEDEQGEKFKINLYDHGCGVVVGDYDGDGHDDVYFLNQLGPNALYKNKGDGTFVDVAEPAGVGLGDRICVGATFADYDNDGRQDLYVTSTRGGNVLFHNEGNGTFQNATEKAGLTLVAHSQTATFFDYDNDGSLDLFVTNSAKWTTDYEQSVNYFRGRENLWTLALSPKEYNVLYRNNRDGTFTNVTDEADLKGQGWGGDVAVFDYDEDGNIDLFVTNMFGQSQLYRNLGTNKFADVTRDTLGRTSWGAIGSKVFDCNNDGKLDLLIVDMHSDMWTPAGVSVSVRQLVEQNERTKFSSVIGPQASSNKSFDILEKKLTDEFQIQNDKVLFGNTMFLNLGGGQFEEISDKANLETFWPWGIATGDFDNDANEDAFVPSGMGYPFFYWPNALMMSHGDGTFEDRSRAEGIEPPPRGIYLEQKIGETAAARSSRCAATADFDGDGRLDLIVNNFNDGPYSFRNEFPRRNYVEFRLQGTKSNRDAVGAVLKLHVGGKVLTRQVHAAGGYLSQSSKTLHFGLGDCQEIDRVEIRWPRGLTQVIDNPEINRLHALTEPEQ